MLNLLFIETNYFLGHCFEAYTGNPPRGLQLSLGTKQVENVMDTIVMANLGYLQLKSSPGRWLLKLRQGRSDELYDIVSIDGKIFRQNNLDWLENWGKIEFRFLVKLCGEQFI